MNSSRPPLWVLIALSFTVAACDTSAGELGSSDTEGNAPELTSSGEPPHSSPLPSGDLTMSQVMAFGEINPVVVALFASNPIVDGLMEPARFSQPTSYMTHDYTSVVDYTSVNVISGKLASASCSDKESRPCANDGFADHVARYSAASTNTSINLVKDAGMLSCNDIRDDVPELIPYVQKAWRIDVGSNPAADAAANVGVWFNSGLRVVQLAYNNTANNDLYAPGEHYAGGAGSSEGLTALGTLVAAAAMRTGIMLDVSHMSDASVADITDMAILRAQQIGRPVPVLANHRNVRELCTDCSFPERNMTLDMACKVAATGGVIGVTPVGTTMMNEGDSFENLIDHIDALAGHTCSINAWDGSPIVMIDHIAVASDAGINGTAEFDGGAQNMFFVDADASDPQRWLILATAMLSPTGSYSQEELRKIFGGNLLRAYRLGLNGSLPFGDAACDYAEGALHLADVDGDGITDALFHDDNGGTWIDHAEYSGGALEGADWDRGTAPGADPNWCATGGSYQLLHGDVDGDGRADLICQHTDGRTWIDRADASGRFFGTNWSRTSDASADNSWCALSSTQTLQVGDVNGDGRDDLICHNSAGATWVDLADSSGRFRGTNWSRTSDPAADSGWCSINAARKLVVGDVNGDGRDDLVCQNTSGGTWVDLADSSGRFRGTDWSRGSDAAADSSWCSIGSNKTVYLADVSGDGRDDLICHNSTSGATWVDFADSSGRFRGTNSFNATPFCRAVDGGTVHTGDRNGDGRADMVCFQQSTGALYERFGSSAGFGDVLE